MKRLLQILVMASAEYLTVLQTIFKFNFNEISKELKGGEMCADNVSCFYFFNLIIIKYGKCKEILYV